MSKRFEDLLDLELGRVRQMLLDKNRRYGNSALEPARIFSKSDSVEQINVRIDDKLNNVISKQEVSDVKFEALSNKVDVISARVDTISHRQELNKRDIDYRFLLQSNRK